MSLIPFPYNIIAGIVASGALIIGVKVYWDHTVDEAVTAKINAYVAQKVKDDADLAEIVLSDNSKIKLKLLSDEATITHVVTQNQTVIDAKVPDIDMILSEGWISAFNSSVVGIPIDPVAAHDPTPSGVSVVQALDTINTNNGIAQANLDKLTACQAWITKAAADVAAENNKVKKQ